MFNAFEIGDCTIADHHGWIYVIHAIDWRVLYVGQTYSSGGALARLSQHLSHGESATFRQRLCAVRRYETIEIGAVKFSAWMLSGIRKFSQQEYREAVEWNIQNAFLNHLAANSKAISVISRVRANGYVGDPDVSAEVVKIKQALPSCIS
ncbi:GIY-YIG nuclease family protein [Mycobacterium colombiense]|uniref:GIY-YIG nuclease family protein n=1 Tax=Mycobacterium colombiense TaxID=339268 RepID=UPI003464DAA3